MKVGERWLREWVDPPLDADGIARQLTMLGLEVDGVERLGSLDRVVVGRVLDVAPHPNADRLRLCRVDAGQHGELGIVCGAANVAAGGRYPVALEGAVLPSGLEIRASVLRGEPSAGMLCSAAELGLADAADGLLELDTDAPPGQPVAPLLGLEDAVIDVDLTPNRADCFSMLGVARDLAAALSLPFEEPRVAPVLDVHGAVFPVRLDATAACPVFAGRIVRGLRGDATTPAWLAERLRAAGVRPISPVVDVTNYVMLEFGQPMHAYDLARLDRGIVVRCARPAETLTLLDEQTVELQPDMLVIADASGPVGLAGIMGGLGTAVNDATRDVFLESAFFAPTAIAGRARRLGLHTDASMRFERGVDPTGQARAIERATALLLEIAGGEPGPVRITRADAAPGEAAAVELRRARLATVLGTTIPDAEVGAILARLGMRVETIDTGWRVVPPAFRFDIAIEPDLVEEVARLYGYDRIPASTAAAPLVPAPAQDDQADPGRVRLALVDRGYQEAVTYSFCAPELDAAFAGGTSGRPLANPISTALSVMRQTLWPGLVDALARNVNRQERRVRLFEIGPRFVVDGDETRQQAVISGCAVGRRWLESWGAGDATVDFFDVKGDVEALAALAGVTFQFEPAAHPALRPGRTARVLFEGRAVGWLGELHPNLVARFDLPAAPLLFELEAGAVIGARVPKFAGVSRFPAVRRDLALVVPGTTPVGGLLTEAREAGGDVLREVFVFDVYTGDKVETGSKSVALGLILQDASRTLADADIDAVVRGVADRLARRFNASLRE